MSKFAVIINTYNPDIYRIQKLIESLRTDTENDVALFIIVVDSSPSPSFLQIDHILSAIQGFQEIKHLKVENLGEPSSLNHAIEYAKLNIEPDLIMILTDDAIVYKEIPYKIILEYFIRNCNLEKDILSITDSKLVHKKIVNRVTENGMVFSPKLFDKLKFREDLVMDQFDLIFCDSINSSGGKIIVFPDSIIWQGPIGREEKNGHNYLPHWRVYLLIRNTIALYLEGKENFLRDVLIQDFSWAYKCFFYSHQKLKCIKAIFLGIYDGLTHRLGVTENLQELSGNRFGKDK